MEGPSREVEVISDTSDHHQASESSTDSGTTQDELEKFDQLITHCKCPCGQKEFSHCINPPPECLALRYANPLGFPEMDVTKGRDEEKAKKAMQQHLLAKTESLKESFTDYGMSVYYYARSVNGVDSPLKNILRLRYPEKVPTTDMTDFEAIYTAVTEDVDFLNFEPLERVVKACDRASGNEHTDGCQTVSDAKKRYEDAFLKFAQLRVFSVVNGLQELCPPVQEGVYPKLKIKVEEDFEAFTIHCADVFREKVRKVLHIPKEVLLRLTDVRQGCVEITFEIIGRVDESTFEIDLLKKKALASINISMLEYAGKVYYCCCEFSTNEGSVIEKLYSRDCSILPCKPSRLTMGNNLELAKSDKSKHLADCPSIQDKLKRCPSEDCVYCGAKHYFCSIESHTLVCGSRKGVSSDDDEVFDHDQSEEKSIDEQFELKQITKGCTQEVVAEPSEPIPDCEDGFIFQFNTLEANLSSRALENEKEFEAKATRMIGPNFSGPCLICLNTEALTIKHIDGQPIAKWPYRVIKKFGSAFKDPDLLDKQQLNDWFSFKSGRRGPYGVAEYSFALSQGVLTELKEALTKFAGIEFCDSAGSEESCPTLYPQLSNTSTNTDCSEAEYSSPSHKRYGPSPAVTGPPLPPRDYLKSSKYKRRKSSPKSELDTGNGAKSHKTIPLQEVKDPSKFPNGVPGLQALPSENMISKEVPFDFKGPDLADNTSHPQLSPLLPPMSSSYELHQQHHIHSVSEEGETILNVSSTIRGRRSSKDRHSSAFNSMPDIDSGYVMFTPGPHPKLSSDSKDQKLENSAVPPPMTMSLPDYGWFEEKNNPRPL